MADRVTACVISGFSIAKLRVIFRSNSVFQSFFKDGFCPIFKVLLSFINSNASAQLNVSDEPISD